MPEQGKDTKPEIVDQSPKYVFETSSTEPEANLSSVGQMLIGGFIGFSPIFLVVLITAWGAFVNLTPLICGSAIVVLGGSAFAFTHEEGAWKSLGTGLLIGYFGGFVFIFLISLILILVSDLRFHL